MRRKVSTLLDEHLYLRAKLEAVREGRQISELIGEALARYLNEEGSPSGFGAVVEKSRGAIRISREELAALMEEEDGFLGA